MLGGTDFNRVSRCEAEARVVCECAEPSLIKSLLSIILRERPPTVMPVSAAAL